MLEIVKQQAADSASGILLDEQPAVGYEVSAAGDLTITQGGGAVTIRRDNLLAFYDRLGDAIGIAE
jgi:hypothetical protein